MPTTRVTTSEYLAGKTRVSTSTSQTNMVAPMTQKNCHIELSGVDEMTILFYEPFRSVWRDNRDNPRNELPRRLCCA